MKAVVLAAAALAAMATSAPAAAVVTTFATFSATGGANARWVNSGTSATRTSDAVYYTTSTPTSNVAGPVGVTFSFINSAIAAAVTDVSASYSLNAIVARNSPIVVSGTTLIQPGIIGSFSFLSAAPITVSGPGLTTTFYAAGSNLLSGTFSGGSLIAARNGTAGAGFASGINGATISYTSDFLNFDALAELDRSIAFTAITPRSFVGANGALRSFRAVTGGQFSVDPNPIPVAANVPEPSAWALLVAGFGLVGVSMRRRKHSVTA